MSTNLENLDFEEVKEKLQNVYTIKSKDGKNVAEEHDIYDIFTQEISLIQKWDFLNLLEEIGFIKKMNNKGSFVFYTVLV